MSKPRKPNNQRAKCHPDREHMGKGYCAACYHKNIGKYHGHRRLYGIDRDAFDGLWEDNQGRCGVCFRSFNGTTVRYAVDHDHETGTVRGLLCRNCNTALGMMRDDVAVAEGAYRYLKYFKQPH